MVFENSKSKYLIWMSKALIKTQIYNESLYMQFHPVDNPASLDSDHPWEPVN